MRGSTLPCSVVPMTLPSSLRSGSVTTCSPPIASAGEVASSPSARCFPSWCCSTPRPTRTSSVSGFYGLRHDFRDCFAELPGYGRFVSLMSRLLMPFYLLLYSFRGEETGINFADGTRPAACRNACINRDQFFPMSGQAWSQHHGVVLWFQASSIHQPQGPAYGLQDHR